MAILGIASTQGVGCHYDALCKKGLLSRDGQYGTNVRLAGIDAELRVALRAILDRKLAEIDAKGLR